MTLGEYPVLALAWARISVHQNTAAPFVQYLGCVTKQTFPRMSAQHRAPGRTGSTRQVRVLNDAFDAACRNSSHALFVVQARHIASRSSSIVSPADVRSACRTPCRASVSASCAASLPGDQRAPEPVTRGCRRKANHGNRMASSPALVGNARRGSRGVQRLGAPARPVPAGAATPTAITTIERNDISASCPSWSWNMLARARSLAPYGGNGRRLHCAVSWTRSKDCPRESSRVSRTP